MFRRGMICIVGVAFAVGYLTLGHGELVEAQTTPKPAVARPSPDELQAANGNTTVLRELVNKFPDDVECKYWLAVALIRAKAKTDELMEAGRLLESIPANATPPWLSVWKRRQLARLAVTLLEEQGLPPSEDVFDLELVKRLERATIRQSRFTAEQVRSDLAQMKEWLTERWSYAEEKSRQTGKTIDQAFAARLAQIEPDMLPADAVQLLERLAADMSDGHVFFSNPSVKRLGLPVRLKDTVDGVVVEFAQPACVGVERGDLVKRLNDTSVEEWIARQEAITSCSTSAARRAWAIRDMSVRLVREEHVSPNTSVAMTVERGGQEQTINCGLVDEGSWYLPENQPPGNMSWLQSSGLPNQVGYLRVKTWAPEPVDATSEAGARLRTEVDKVLADQRDAKAMIVDVRGNPGGHDWLCTYFASHFVPAPYPVYVLRHREGDRGFGNPWMVPARCGAHYPAFKGERFKGNVYLLVDRLSYSATDTLLAVMTAHIPDRVALIGRPSGAGIGGPKVVGNLRHTGLAVHMSHCKAFHFRDKSKTLEGVAAAIDHPVEWTRQDVIYQRDPDLEKALELIAVAASTD